MRRSLLLLSLLALGCVALAQTDFDEADPTFQSFMSYVKTFEKKYKSLEEMMIRMDNYRASLERVAKLNSDGNNVYGITKFSDMSPEEFKAAYLGFRPNHHSRRHHKTVHPTKNHVHAVSSWDWRDHGAVTPVKDQAQCGSCWAFSTAEEIESAWFMANHSLVSLSPQQIVSCDTVDQACNGGDTVTAYAYVQQAGGLEKESAYPYVSGGGDDPACSFDASKIAAKIKGFAYATPPCQDSCTNQDEQTLLNNLVEKGPVSICVDAETWQDYTGGIVTDNCDKDYSELDHCVQVVGFNTSGGTKYWLVRNSWNTDWGEAGYIYIKYGDNLCGIADEATLADI